MTDNTLDNGVDEYFPVRCYTCNKVLGNKQIPYENMIEQGFHPEQAMDQLGIERYCCRMNVLNPIQVPRGANVGIDEDLLGITRSMNEIQLKGGAASKGVLILAPQGHQGFGNVINTSTMEAQPQLPLLQPKQTQPPPTLLGNTVPPLMSVPPTTLPTVGNTMHVGRMPTVGTAPRNGGMMTRGPSNTLGTSQIGMRPPQQNAMTFRSPDVRPQTIGHNQNNIFQV